MAKSKPAKQDPATHALKYWLRGGPRAGTLTNYVPSGYKETKQKAWSKEAQRELVVCDYAKPKRKRKSK